jgi:hypothetical protein
MDQEIQDPPTTGLTMDEEQVSFQFGQGDEAEVSL